MPINNVTDPYTLGGTNSVISRIPTRAASAVNICPMKTHEPSLMIFLLMFENCNDDIKRYI